MRLFDTHAHYDSHAFDGDRVELLSTMPEQGVELILNPGCDLETSKMAVSLAEQFPFVYAAVGFHPSDCSGYNDELEQQLRQMAAHPKVKAIGEIGLDYYWMEDEPQVQEKIFRRQLAIAREMKMPVSIHTRSKTISDTAAYEDVYRILKEERVPGIIHSFNGDIEWMKRFIDLGMMISFSGVVTFKNAKNVQEAATNVPEQSYLVETDAPYLAPVPFRGKQNEPGYARYVVEKLAELRDVPLEEVALQTTKNAHRLFGLGENG